MRAGSITVHGDKSAQNGDLQVVENFVGNVMGVFREFAEHLCYCGILEGISLISPLSSWAYTSLELRRPKWPPQYLRACKSHICTDLRG